MSSDMMYQDEEEVGSDDLFGKDDMVIKNITELKKTHVKKERDKVGTLSFLVGVLAIGVVASLGVGIYTMLEAKTTSAAVKAEDMKIKNVAVQVVKSEAEFNGYKEAQASKQQKTEERIDSLEVEQKKFNTVMSRVVSDVERVHEKMNSSVSLKKTISNVSGQSDAGMNIKIITGTSPKK